MKTYFLARFSPLPDLEMAGELAGFIHDSRIIGSPGVTMTVFTSEVSIEKLTDIIAMSETYFFLFEITESDVSINVPNEAMQPMVEFVKPIVKKMITIKDRIDEKTAEISKEIPVEQQIKELENQLQAAVDDEDYIRAAQIKKQIDELKKDK